MMVFQNRQDAGRVLSEKLERYKNTGAVILGLARGGVPVAYEIARQLFLPMDVLVIRKIGSPRNSEFGIGAVAPDGIMYLDRETVGVLGVTKEQITGIIKKERDELKRRENLYRTCKAAVTIEDKNVILTDDGLATGVTAMAAIAWIKTKHPKTIILAVPGGPADIVKKMKKLVDVVVCPEIRIKFGAVGGLYESFRQVSDDEVIAILKKSVLDR